MPNRPLVIWPDQRLLKKAASVAAISLEIHDLYVQMTHTMQEHSALALAAPQIGRPVRMLVVEPALAGRQADDQPVVFINPEVLWASEDTEIANEGCLSFPGIYKLMERPYRVRVRALNLDGQAFEIEGEGLLARCLLHQMDLLDGILLKR